MIDLKNHKAAWVQEKVKDLEYLESIDYANLNKLVDDAYASGSAKKIVEAHWEIKKYAPGILKDRSSQIPLKQVDTEIDRLVSTYADIKTRLDKKIITHKAARQNQFHKNYDSNTPNITTLRQISEDYASFQGTIPNLDETILQYAGFDQAWTAVESRVGKATKAYISIKNNKGIKKIQEEIKTCKTALDKTQKQAPKKFLRGIHKAYRYQNAKLVQLDAEVQRFEKEDFAKRRTSAERKIAIASDFINFLQEVDLNDIAPVLREYTQQDFAFDFNGVKNTLYFGSLPQDYTTAVQTVKSLAKERAKNLQTEIKNKLKLDSSFGTIANEDVTDLQNQSRSLTEDYKATADLIFQITEDSSLPKQLDNAILRINSRIESVSKKQANAEEIAARDKQLELQKIALEKEKALRQAKEKEAEEKIKLANESQRLLKQQLSKERANKERLQTRMNAIDSVNRTLEEYRSNESVQKKPVLPIPVISLDHLIKK